MFTVRKMTERIGYKVIPVHPGPVIMVFMKSGSLFVESSMSWVDGYDPETKLFHPFPYNENPTRALKHYLTQMLLDLN